MTNQRIWAEEDPFSVLGVDVQADEAAVRDAYRAALRFHPPERDPEGFKRLRAAYEALRDPTQRVEAAVCRRLWLDDQRIPTAEELGAPRPEPPAVDMLIAELRRLAVMGTDLGRTAFPEDRRVPVPPPWA